MNALHSAEYISYTCPLSKCLVTHNTWLSTPFAFQCLSDKECLTTVTLAKWARIFSCQGTLSIRTFRLINKCTLKESTKVFYTESLLLIVFAWLFYMNSLLMLYNFDCVWIIRWCLGVQEVKCLNCYCWHVWDYWKLGYSAYPFLDSTFFFYCVFSFFWYV
jgi:hypothetical protein